MIVDFVLYLLRNGYGQRISVIAMYVAADRSVADRVRYLGQVRV